MLPPELMFKNSRDRIDRAKVHLRAFNSEWHTIMEAKCASTRARKDTRPGWWIVAMEPTLECIERIESNQLSLILGEIAYQLRAALDGLMWDAITYKQGTEPVTDASSIAFPILKGNERNFDKCRFHKFPFPLKLGDWLRTVQPDAPDKPADDPECGLQNTLEDINDLARFDRHRRLRMVGVVPTTTRVEIERSEPPGGGILDKEWLDCNIFIGKYDYVRIKVACPGGLSPYYVRLKTKMELSLFAEDVQPYGGDDIGVQLHRFIQAVEYVTNRFLEATLADR